MPSRALTTSGSKCSVDILERRRGEERGREEEEEEVKWRVEAGERAPFEKKRKRGREIRYS
jgi:hypothetical protein